MRITTAFAARIAAGIAAGGVAALAAGVLGAGAASAAPAEGQILGAGAPDAVKDSYIVTMKNSATESSRTLAAKFGGTVQKEYGTAMRGFTARLSEKSAKQLAANPDVASVEQDRTVALSATTQTNAVWGLDRIDQRALPLGGTYIYPNAAANVTAYVIDTGINLTHSDFGGRAKSGWDFVDNDADASDCQGHGSHVAGTIGSNTYGVAKSVKLVSVRVLDCQGSGSYSSIIAGIDWVTKNAVKPAVANMSLGGSASAAVDTAVKNSIAAGVTYALAGGNDGRDSCSYSPARTPEAITVGAVDSKDARASFSNYGTCLDIFAPGVGIMSTYKGGTTATTTMSGTSMASPHVAGAAALVLGANPSFTPAQVRDALVKDATPDKVGNPGTGSPNKLLYIGGISVPATTPVTPAPAPTPCTATNTYDLAVADRAAIESKLTVAGCTGNASSTSKVEVHVKHPNRGGLTVTLLAPDGSTYKLKSSVTTDKVANLDATYTANLSTEARNGLWKLRVTDDVTGGAAGFLDSWTLTL